MVRHGAAGRGYTLVALVVTVAVMNVLVAAALPAWSRIIQRDKEAELLFRGMQYAEAIRVFQVRTGRLPTRLEELIEVNPRSIRKLWEDPMTEEGSWGLVFAQAGGQGAADPQGRGGSAGVAPQQGGVQPGAPQDVVRGTAPGESGRRRTAGPIVGVHSLSEEQGIRSFAGGQRYRDWRFTVDLVPLPAVNPATLAVSRANADRVGRPFPSGLEPQQGQPPGGQQRPGPAPPARRRGG